MFAPVQAVVTSLPGEDKLTIAVTLAGRSRFLDRPKGELLERTLMRLQMNAAKHGAGPRAPRPRAYQNRLPNNPSRQLDSLVNLSAKCWRATFSF